MILQQEKQLLRYLTFQPIWFFVGSFSLHFQQLPIWSSAVSILLKIAIRNEMTLKSEHLHKRNTLKRSPSNLFLLDFLEFKTWNSCHTKFNNVTPLQSSCIWSFSGIFLYKHQPSPLTLLRILRWVKAVNFSYFLAQDKLIISHYSRTIWENLLLEL